MSDGIDIVYDLDIAPGRYSPSVLVAEINRLRRLLNECWDAAGLLNADMTGQPYQAWEEPSDLVAEIEKLCAKAELADEIDRANGRVS